MKLRSMEIDSLALDQMDRDRPSSPCSQTRVFHTIVLLLCINYGFSDSASPFDADYLLTSHPGAQWSLYIIQSHLCSENKQDHLDLLHCL